MKREILDPKVFSYCNGWKDIIGNINKGKKHEEYFVVPPLEHLMPDTVPKKARCESCELEFKRYQVSIRVRRYRIQRKQQEILKNYIKAYRANLSGEIVLPKNIANQLYKAIVENGGSLEEKKEEEEPIGQ